MSTATADHYKGPAVLVDDDGDEIPVTARLWAETESVQMVDGAFGDRYPVPGGPVWSGVLEAQVPLSGRRLVIPGTLRFPDGAEATAEGMSGDFASPDRVEVEGSGAAPWNTEAR